MKSNVSNTKPACSSWNSYCHSTQFLDVCLQCGSPILEQCNLLPTIVLLSSDLPTTDSLKRGHGGSGLFWTRWNLSPVKFHRHMAVYTTMFIWIFQFFGFWISHFDMLQYCPCCVVIQIHKLCSHESRRVSRHWQCILFHVRMKEGGWQILTSLCDKYILLLVTNTHSAWHWQMLQILSD